MSEFFILTYSQIKGDLCLFHKHLCICAIVNITGICHI